jgi:signal transduction histidine kinase
VESNTPDEFQKVNSVEILQEALANLTLTIQESEAKITCGPLPPVYGDRIQLSQVFQNLISNAVKYRSTEPVKIHLEAEKKNNECLFSIRDNGSGIEVEHASTIFDLFKRFPTKVKTQGSGIGLAVCKKIVQRHGGKIWVDSTPGKGSTFYFTLPC